MNLLPPLPEFVVHTQVADLLTIALSPGWLWFHVPNGELRNKIIAARLKRMGVKAGVSDFILIAPYGARVHALELKKQNCKPTKLQDAFMAHVRSIGGEAAWTDSFEGAHHILATWHAIRVAR